MTAQRAAGRTGQAGRPGIPDVPAPCRRVEPRSGFQRLVVACWH